MHKVGELSLSLLPKYLLRLRHTSRVTTVTFTAVRLFRVCHRATSPQELLCLVIQPLLVRLDEAGSLNLLDMITDPTIAFFSGAGFGIQVPRLY